MLAAWVVNNLHSLGDVSTRDKLGLVLSTLYELMSIVPPPASHTMRCCPSCCCDKETFHISTQYSRRRLSRVCLLTSSQLLDESLCAQKLILASASLYARQFGMLSDGKQTEAKTDGRHLRHENYEVGAFATDESCCDASLA